MNTNACLFTTIPNAFSPNNSERHESPRLEPNVRQHFCGTLCRARTKCPILLHAAWRKLGKLWIGADAVYDPHSDGWKNNAMDVCECGTCVNIAGLDSDELYAFVRTRRAPRSFYMRTRGEVLQRLARIWHKHGCALPVKRTCDVISYRSKILWNDATNAPCHATIFSKRNPLCERGNYDQFMLRNREKEILSKRSMTFGRCHIVSTSHQRMNIEPNVWHSIIL